MCLAAVSAMGSALGVYSAVQEGRSQSAAYQAQADTADQNAKIAARQAETAAQNGAQEEREMRRYGAATIGAQKTGFAASGIDSGSGSAMDVINDTTSQNELDALAIRKNAANQVWGYQADQTNYKNQASAARSAAKNARTAGNLNAFGAVLNGYSSLQSKYGKK